MRKLILFLLVVFAATAETSTTDRLEFQSKLNGWLCGQVYQMGRNDTVYGKLLAGKYKKMYEAACGDYKSDKFPKY